MPVLYELPSFLPVSVDRTDYMRWLQRKATAHARRDRKRWCEPISISSYKQSMHAAVVRSAGRDFYTGEKLDWSLISQYDNAESKSRGSSYKKQFALLPTVDHVDPNRARGDFEICSWRTNDCKNDLSLVELKRFCRALLKHQTKRSRRSPS